MGLPDNLTTICSGQSNPPGEDALAIVARGLVSDLHAARPFVFWTDMIGSAIVGWTAFGTAVIAPLLSPTMVAACIIGAFALYRGLCFTHEITHLRRRALPGFETTWNILFGVPLLLPSFTYVGVHQSHHSLSTYGTKDDPEYLPFATSRTLIVIFAVQASIVMPVALLTRFLILAPVGLVWPRFHRWLEVYASSFSMNPAYRRMMSASGARATRRWEVVILAAWSAMLAALYYSVLPSRTLLVWLAVLVLVSFVNALRVLGAHEYDSDGVPLDRQGQLRDSIDTPGGWWTELWAPVGLRYHALHHYFPGIPYHNLGIAYRRIVQQVPADSPYRLSTSPSLRQSLRNLYVKATSRSRGVDRTVRPDSGPHDAFRDHQPASLRPH
jgi:fatty acid desaturase